MSYNFSEDDQTRLEEVGHKLKDILENIGLYMNDFMVKLDIDPEVFASLEQSQQAPTLDQFRNSSGQIYVEGVFGFNEVIFTDRVQLSPDELELKKTLVDSGLDELNLTIQDVMNFNINDDEEGETND